MPVHTAKARTKARAVKGSNVVRTTRRRLAENRTAKVSRPSRSSIIPPSLIRPTLSRHMLVDGFDIVVDLKKRGERISSMRETGSATWISSRSWHHPPWG